MIILNGLGIVDEFRLNGPWIPFTDINPGPFFNKQVYFDSNQNEYNIGSGPAPLLGSGGSLTNFIDPITGVVSIAPTSIPVSSSANIIPQTTNSLSDLINSIPGGSTINTIVSGSILGVPNWILLLGIAGFFFITESKGNRR